ncbi:Double Clp-N motif-containing P-loop nucleoside triphosphate hydrolases superfamily protein [Raphanus sativus]|nr:Double Clp-N motif-containing P-loop nucleoside triphosphate hydrolases superfamily protein [Raphanus sativus]
MPSSLLREVCVSRVPPGALPTRRGLQFRALELCVGVFSRQAPVRRRPSPRREKKIPGGVEFPHGGDQAVSGEPAAAPGGVPPPPDARSVQTATVLKVELKYFVLSILDDPIVNRVFCDAGFRSSEYQARRASPSGDDYGASLAVRLSSSVTSELGSEP